MKFRRFVTKSSQLSTIFFFDELIIDCSRQFRQWPCSHINVCLNFVSTVVYNITPVFVDGFYIFDFSKYYFFRSSDRCVNAGMRLNAGLNNNLPVVAKTVCKNAYPAAILSVVILQSSCNLDLLSWHIWLNQTVK